MLKTFEVNNIRCGGCANSITKALEKKGFKSVYIDLSCEPRKVTLELQDKASSALFRDILRKLGYSLCNEDISFSASASLKAKSFVSCAVGKFTIENNTK
ncbi:MAG: heavy metal-associated domain-containing protein [Campylobacterota bacterium]|nr:heavy metal-associated domain-containing protein [Campylobacterota bacterium]